MDDPADTGPDAAGLAIRHGAKVLEMALKHDGDVSDAFDWSIDHLDRFHCSDYVYDGDGLGLGLAREVERAMAPRNIPFEGFRGGATPENPSGMFNGFKNNRDAFHNKKKPSILERPRALLENLSGDGRRVPRPGRADLPAEGSRAN